MPTANPLPLANSANPASSFTPSNAAPRADFSGLWLPLVTPFSGADRTVDHAALKRMLAHYRHSGIAGYVVCGSTGEAAALSEAEQWAVLGTVLAHADGLPVVMGFSGYNLAEALAFVHKANQLPSSASSAANSSSATSGLVGLLVAAPHYIRPSQDGLISWFEAIADASAKPLILYDIPYRTGVHMTLATLRRLAAHPMVQAIKDCGGDTAKTQQLIADGRLQVLAGEDIQMFGTVAAGGRGAIAACAHVCSGQFAEVIRLLQDGRLAEARRLWAPLLPLIAALFAEPNPACIKSALAQIGLLENSLREPMQAASQPVQV